MQILKKHEKQQLWQSANGNDIIFQSLFLFSKFERILLFLEGGNRKSHEAAKLQNQMPNFFPFHTTVLL